MKPNRIAIIGLGLIGGSLARALKSADAALHISAADRDKQALRSALEQQVIDQAGDLAGICSGSDLVIIAVPPLAAPAVLRELEQHVTPRTVITDVASAKAHLLETLATANASFSRRVVPGHPLAGSEQSGFAASVAGLFRGRNVVLTPADGTDPEAIARVHNLWRMLGANVLAMSAARHDRILALTSHLPHLLAFALADLLARRETGQDVNHYAASGFADFTRLAASNPELWADIISANAAATAGALESFIDDLQQMRKVLVEQDRPALLARLHRARLARDDFDLAHGGAEKLRSRRERCFHVRPGGTVNGRIRVPGDKSISHRAVILGSIAEGVTRVSGFLEGEDSLNTLAAFRELGVTIVGPENGNLTIYGVGMNGLQAPRKPLYMGNSGTAMRLMAGVLAGQDFASELFGDESLSGRPMNRIVEPLSAMGAKITAASKGHPHASNAATKGHPPSTAATKGHPPLHIEGANLQCIKYDMPVASAQVKSCLLLASLYADGVTTIREPGQCRDHTERMLRGFGVALDTNQAQGTVSISGGQSLRASSIEVPADISSAAFFMVAAAITPGAAVTLEHVGINPTRIGVVRILREMGADIRMRNKRESGGEPVADLEVRQRPLHGVDIGEEQVALAIDEFPVLLIAAACAEGETRVTGAQELRVKESDRIEAMARGLSVLGIENETWPDGIRVVGGAMGGGVIDSEGDHRIAMAFAVAGLCCSGELTIRNCANVATSFPGFAGLARKAGFDITEADASP